MTPQEMNVKIAEILGLDYAIAVRFCPNREEFLVYDDGSMEEISYTTDKALCLDLVDMLGEEGWDYSKDNGIHCWGKNMGDHYFTVENESLLLATCEAFIEEHK